jgi:acyl phosphate:glycerol-3-phosphate acyltransferase
MPWIEYLNSADWNQATGIVLCAYLLGCFATGYYLVRWLTGKDIREIGSGSVGARNVSRLLGKTGFFLTVFFDSAKGVLAVTIARQFTLDDRLIILAMLAVVAGHVWPAQLRFHGGKGMATSLGSLLMYDPHLAVTFAITFVCLFALFRKTILPGLFALASLPFASVFFNPTADKGRLILLSLWVGLVLFAHRKNFVDEFAQLAARRQQQPEP